MKQLAIALLALALSACDDGHLRGSVEQSPDGETYLAVMDDNGGQCGPIKVDGAIWPHKIGESGRIAPGAHRIECGTSVSFEIPQGVVFRFNYWGP